MKWYKQTTLAILVHTAVLVIGQSGMPTNVFTNGLVQALNNLNAHTLGEIVKEVPEIFETYLGRNNSPVTLIAPLNNAFYNSGISQLAPAKLQQLLSYHILDGWIPYTDGRYIASSFFTRSRDDPSQSQKVVVDVTQDGAKINISTALKTLAVEGRTTYMNVHIWTVPEFIGMPGDFFDTLSILGLGDVADFVTNAHLKQVIRSMYGLTAFVPTSQALSEDVYAHSGTDDEDHEIALRHFLRNDSLFYSPDLIDGLSLETLDGSCVTIVESPDGMKQVVGHDGYTIANILRSDILLSNGVMHIIDKVL